MEEIKQNNEELVQNEEIKTEIPEETGEIFEVTRGKTKRDAMREERKALMAELKAEDVDKEEPVAETESLAIINELETEEVDDPCQDDEESWTEYKHRILDKIKEMRGRCKGKVILAFGEVQTLLNEIESEVKK